MTLDTPSLLKKRNVRNDVPQVCVAQIGARQHYRIPHMLLRWGALAGFFTDVFDPIPLRLRGAAERYGTRGVKRALGRTNSDLRHLAETPPLPVALAWLGCRQVLWSTRLRQRFDAAQGAWFARAASVAFSTTEWTTFLGFSLASLEAIETATAAGRLSVLDVTSPGEVEEDIVRHERERFPDWEDERRPTPAAYRDRIEREWLAADRLLVNSAWSKAALERQGVSSSKLHVVPIAYERPSRNRLPRTRRADEPLRVLWLGTLCLRKGLPYALQAAHALQRANVRFTFAGPLAVRRAHIELPPNAHYVGQVPRIFTGALWQNHDVFLLPTLSDGFAITQIEAIAHGLPVIATHRCGDVAEDGVSGFLVEARSAASIVSAVQRFLDQPGLLETMSAAAFARANRFHPSVVGNELLDVVTP